jgi:clan AA aspartic protease
MIVGQVTADREAVIRVALRKKRGGRRTVTVVIDTGFDGWLTLPEEVVEELSLAWSHRSRAQLADGSEIYFDVYVGVVIWNGQPLRVLVDSANVEPLLGMSLLEGHQMTMEIREGGRVAIRPL